MKTKDLTETERYRLAEKMLDEHQIMCVSALMDYVLRKSWDETDTPIAHDDIQNMRPDPDEWDIAQCEEYIQENLPTPTTQRSDYEVGEEEEYLEFLRDYIRDNAPDAEIFEWYAVDEWLLDRLQERKECVIDGVVGIGRYWGRCTTGQSVSLDYAIQHIAVEWSEKR
jgi:hypothetical protein